MVRGPCSAQKSEAQLQAGAQVNPFSTPHFAISEINTKGSIKFWIFCLQMISHLLKEKDPLPLVLVK